MIKAYRTIALNDFLERIIPKTDYAQDKLLSDFSECVQAEKDFIMIYKDYEIKVLLAEVQAYMAEHWSLDTGQPADLPDPLDALLPRVPTPRVETPEEREIAAKHPKERPEFPKFKPGKKAPAAPSEDEIL